MELILISTLAFFLFSSTAAIDVEVGDLGWIKGIKAITSKNQVEYTTFTNIPYADPKSYTGENRFRPSEIYNVPYGNETNPWPANNTNVMCPQRPILELPEFPSQPDIITVLNGTSKSRHERFRKLQEGRKNGKRAHEMNKILGDSTWGTEECLTLSISTPKLANMTDGEKLPVIVYFHGGGSDSVFGSVFMGLRLLERKVVLVTPNYRLGVLGAFNLGVDDAPGCEGPYDGVTALIWVQKYITYFGGDPDRVTISGQSAGAMMATHLMLSNLAKGLFHRVVGFSGSALSVWATAEENSMPHHLKIASLTGCYENGAEVNKTEIITCMKNATILQLVNAMDIYEEDEMHLGRLGFDARMPSIQNSELTIPKFLPKDPLKILEEGEQSNVPVMLGATKHDGSYPLDDIYIYYLKYNGLLENEDYLRNEMLPELLNMLGFKDPSRGLYHSFTREYLGETSKTGDFDSKIPGLIDMSTVFGFKAGQYRFLEEHSRVNPQSYFYTFDYKGKWTLYNVLQGLDKKIPGGIAHTDEQMYLFWMGPMLDEDARVSERMIDYYVNFAYYGNPNGNLTENDSYWKPFEKFTTPYLEINRQDKMKFNARDSWINGSLELVSNEDPEDTTTTTTTTTTTRPGSDPYGPSSTTEYASTSTESGSTSLISSGTFIILSIVQCFKYFY